MEEKSNLYIVAIVGVVAVVALVILVLGVGTRQSEITLTDDAAADDSAGQVYQAAPTPVEGGGVSGNGATGGRPVQLSTDACIDTDSHTTDTDIIGYNLFVKGTTTMSGVSYTDTCVYANKPINSCSGSSCFIKEYSCFRPYIVGGLLSKSKLGNQYALNYAQVPCSKCINGVCYGAEYPAN